MVKYAEGGDYLDKDFLLDKLLLLNIDRLIKELKIKKSGDLKHLDNYKILQFEVKALKESTINGPNYVEISAILFSTFAIVISMFTLLLNIESETIFRLTKSREINDMVEHIGEVKYIVKEAYEVTEIFSTYILYLFGIFILMISMYFSIKQINLSGRIKKIVLLEQCLDEYIKLIESNKS